MPTTHEVSYIRVPKRKEPAMGKFDFTVVSWSGEGDDAVLMVRMSKAVFDEVGYACENVLSELGPYEDGEINAVLMGGETDNDELKSVAVASMVMEQVKQFQTS